MITRENRATNLPTKQKIELQLCYNAVVEKKAEDLKILDLRSLSSVVDFFIICHCLSSRQVLAVCDQLETNLRGSGNKGYSVEGRGQAEWVLVDDGDIVVHIFQESVRRHYELEKLWMDAPIIDGDELTGDGYEK